MEGVGFSPVVKTNSRRVYVAERGRSPSAAGRLRQPRRNFWCLTIFSALRLGTSRGPVTSRVRAHLCPFVVDSHV